MPSLSSVSNAVALLAPQTAARIPPGGVALEAAAAAPGVSPQPSPARVLAASTISSALLEVKPEPTGAAKAALDYLDSEDFEISDPEAKLVLADIIRYGAETFNRKFAVEQAKDPKLTFNQVLGKTIERTILDNRERFPPGEFVLGMRDENGAVALVSIAAIGARTTVQGELTARLARATAGDERAASESAATGRPHERSPDLAEAEAALADWTLSWQIGFGFAEPPQ